MSQGTTRIGRVVSTRSELKVFRAHGALHVWPAVVSLGAVA
jgi:hypothetical protein